jgi:hypothetical protein
MIARRAVLVAVAVTVCNAAGAFAAQPPHTISNHGRPASLDRAQRASSVFSGAVRVRLLHRYPTFSVYEFRRGGETCFASWTATDRSGPATCAVALADRPPPVIDWSGYLGRPDDRVAHVVQVSGVASDAVRTVTALDATGDVLARTTVVGNTYEIGPQALSPGASKVEFPDRAGREVYESPPGGSMPPCHDTGSGSGV